jgi:hypothetical protein
MTMAHVELELLRWDAPFAVDISISFSLSCLVKNLKPSLPGRDTIPLANESVQMA